MARQMLRYEKAKMEKAGADITPRLYWHAFSQLAKGV